MKYEEHEKRTIQIFDDRTPGAVSAGVWSVCPCGCDDRSEHTGTHYLRVFLGNGRGISIWLSQVEAELLGGFNIPQV